ncbi:hypothetical protein F4813DRAFT_255919 [Daldinia decipiens]|uniref:uncharacterized protein n=1 Tax=Daldinia decipiens TaxID=326647 RepID=UPI0020C4622C|nr:uncharacterized protein F4813DRAFT_255919 [Daldinia decipiens]KAI1653398.1 hypothetical protein F4813DRAFT_255919 [Daldinia decipiens]
MDFLITDIQEKEVTVPTAPSFPQVKSTTTGFPEHKKRTRISAFKQKRQAAKPEGDKPKGEKPKVFTTGSKEPLCPPSQDAQQTTRSSEDFKLNEQQSIDRENNDRLASMSPEEIEAARQELFNGLDPSILEMLLKRANLDESTGPSPFDPPKSTSQDASSDAKPTQDSPEIVIEDTSAQSNSNKPNKKPSEQSGAESATTNSSKRVRWASVADEEEEEEKMIPEMTPTPTSQPPSDNNTAQNPPSTEPTEQRNTTDPEQTPTKPHWPQPPQPGDLDPHDPDFLQKLHDKYFPSLPADPSKLAWMAPVPTPNSPADYDSPYHPQQDSLPVSVLRFDFRGSLLPPRIARAVPVTKGLHHHGEAPEAAGYTVRELARLCRSAVPGQRCVAYQTLGRILYRLGRGEFGGVDAAVAQGIWADVEDGAVMRSLYEEAGTEEGRGHRSARVFAIEAIWLYEKGGWKERLRKGK